MKIKNILQKNEAFDVKMPSAQAAKEQMREKSIQLAKQSEGSFGSFIMAAMVTAKEDGKGPLARAFPAIYKVYMELFK